MNNQEPPIIYSTQPILYDTGYDEWPYAYAGSCYPVRWKNNLYVISAYHCFENHDVRPEKTLYQIPDSKPQQSYGFNIKLTLEANDSKKDKYKDLVILVVSNELHTKDIIDLTDALDISEDKNLISFSEPDIIDVWLRGYLSGNPSHKIDYENKKIRPQAYTTNGFISSRESDFEFCYLLKVKNPTPDGLIPDGMSGSPVYAINKQGKFGLAGTVIEFNELTNEYLVIDSIVLREYLKRESSIT